MTEIVLWGNVCVVIVCQRARRSPMYQYINDNLKRDGHVWGRDRDGEFQKEGEKKRRQKRTEVLERSRII
jgi:hypothetical protein